MACCADIGRVSNPLCNMNRGIGNSNIKFCLLIIFTSCTSSNSGCCIITPALGETFCINNGITYIYASDCCCACRTDSTSGVTVYVITYCLCCYSHIAYMDVPT